MISTGAAATINRDNPDDVARFFSRICGWGIPAREAGLVLEGLRSTTALGYAQEFLTASAKPPSSKEESPNLLVLAGPKGVGKTLAAAHVMLHADPIQPYGGKWRTEHAPRFRHATELAEVSLYGEADKPERLALKNTKCLVIDDLGTEIATEHFLTLFDGVFNARYGGYGLTVLTTNLTAPSFSARYGERVYDRIAGRGMWFDISEESMRGR